MDHHDHVALIREGVVGAGRRWLELGAGDGAFTLALADVLGPGGSIVTLDRDAGAIKTGAERVGRAFADVDVRHVQGDFTRGLPIGPFDGVLAANSLHFVADRGPVLARIRDELRPGGHLVIVEYDADRGNPWVPHPFTPEQWRKEAGAAGFGDIRVLHRVPSRFLGGIYGALAGKPVGPERRKGEIGGTGPLEDE